MKSTTAVSECQWVLNRFHKRKKKWYEPIRTHIDRRFSYAHQLIVAYLHQQLPVPTQSHCDDSTPLFLIYIKFVKYLPSTFLSFNIRSYVQRAKEVASDRTLHHVNSLNVTYKNAICVISLNIAFNSHRVLNMDFINAENCAISKRSFVNNKSPWETFHEINSATDEGNLSVWTAKNRFWRLWRP